MVQAALEKVRRTSHDSDAWVTVGHPTDEWSEANCVAVRPGFRQRSRIEEELHGAGFHFVSFQNLGPSEDSTNLRERLDNANAHFRRKAAQVLDDDDALKLLDDLYQNVVQDIQDTEIPAAGVGLAKLAAANFCEVGANVIYITHAGRRFVESINRS